LVCEKCVNQRIDFEYNEDIIFLKENYRRYNESLTYDLRGNILTMNRTGYYTDAGSCLYNNIDNLTYNYAANTNKLTSALSR